MERIGLYGHDGSFLCDAWRTGAIAAGWSPALRSASDFRLGDTEDFAVAVIMTMRANGAMILEQYGRRKPIVPTYVVDYGWLRRVYSKEDFETGHWQVSLGGLNSIPPNPCPPDRWNALGIDIVERGGDPDGEVLVCSQHVDDPSHGMGHAALEAWATEICARYLDRGDHVRFRPHPSSRNVQPMIKHPRLRIDAIDAKLVDALDDVKLLVTICSTSGLEALLRGVPAVATMPKNAVWGALSGETIPSVDDRVALCSRIAYQQWTLSEIRSGAWFRWYEGSYEGAPLRVVSEPALKSVPMRPLKQVRSGARGGRRGA